MSCLHYYAHYPILSGDASPKNKSANTGNSFFESLRLSRQPVPFVSAAPPDFANPRVCKLCQAGSMCVCSSDKRKLHEGSMYEISERRGAPKRQKPKQVLCRAAGSHREPIIARRPLICNFCTALKSPGVFVVLVLGCVGLAFADSKQETFEHADIC